MKRDPNAREWTWETKETFDPTYWASETPDGISYLVHMHGPAGGYGMAGYQSYEELLARGPLNQMPPAIEAEVRAFAEQKLNSVDRALLRWELRVEAPQLQGDQQLAYVSAAIGEHTIVVQVLEEDHVVLFHGSRRAGPARLALLAGFGRPWRQPGARTARLELDIECAAGTATTVSFLVTPELTLVSREYPIGSVPAR